MYYYLLKQAPPSCIWVPNTDHRNENIKNMWKENSDVTSTNKTLSVMFPHFVLFVIFFFYIFCICLNLHLYKHTHLQVKHIILYLQSLPLPLKEDKPWIRENRGRLVLLEELFLTGIMSQCWQISGPVYHQMLLELEDNQSVNKRKESKLSNFLSLMVSH